MQYSIYTHKYLTDIGKALYDIRRRAVLLNMPPTEAICISVGRYRQNDDSRLVLSDMMATWSEHSGHPEYPVPSYCDLSPREMYYRAIDEGTLYSRHTSYGQARLRLLDHCLRECMWYERHMVRGQAAGRSLAVTAPHDEFCGPMPQHNHENHKLGGKLAKRPANKPAPTPKARPKRTISNQPDLFED